MKVGIIGAGAMGQGIAKAFAQTEGYEVALCDVKQERADGLCQGHGDGADTGAQLARHSL